MEQDAKLEDGHSEQLCTSWVLLRRVLPLLLLDAPLTSIILGREDGIRPVDISHSHLILSRRWIRWIIVESLAQRCMRLVIGSDSSYAFGRDVPLGEVCRSYPISVQLADEREKEGRRGKTELHRHELWSMPGAERLTA